jgi:hypothetical protein
VALSRVPGNVAMISFSSVSVFLSTEKKVHREIIFANNDTMRHVGISQ